MPSEPLNAKQLAHLRKSLESKAAELSLQLQESRENTDPVALDQQSVGRVSRIDAIQQQQMAVANRDQSRLLLKQVTDALHRFESGDYGLCLECGEPVAYARLEAQPYTPYCLDCQSALERK